MKKKLPVKRIILIVVLTIIFLPPFVKYQQISWKSRELDNQIRALKEEIKKLEAEKIRLQTDITYVERRAREKIGVVKKGEIILRETSPKK
ncbi:MAG: septum formation initiator family protein [Candidatus Omnitrophota bacterium]